MSSGEKQKTQDHQNTSDLLVGLLFLGLAVFIIVESAGMLHRGQYLVDAPGFIPLLMGVSLLVLSVIIITQMIIKKAYLDVAGWTLDNLRNDDFKRWMAVFGITAVYFILVGRFSFYVLTFAYLLAMFLYFRSTKIWLMLLVSFGVSLLVYLVFYLGFRMPLP